MALRPVMIDELADEHFVGTAQNNKVTYKVKIDPVSGNKLQSTSAGLKVVTPSVQEYAPEIRPNYALWDGIPEQRGYLQVRDGFGLLKLDVKKTGNTTSTHVANLPANAPTPAQLIEIQIYDGTNSVTCWISAGSRQIHSQGMSLNKRYIFNLFGYFR